MKRLMIVLAAIGALGAGCAAPNPNSVAGAGGVPRQDCASCQLENPGDVVVCERICHEYDANQMGPGSGSALH